MTDNKWVNGILHVKWPHWPIAKGIQASRHESWILVRVNGRPRLGDLAAGYYLGPPLRLHSQCFHLKASQCLNASGMIEQLVFQRCMRRPQNLECLYRFLPNWFLIWFFKKKNIQITKFHQNPMFVFFTDQFFNFEKQSYRKTNGHSSWDCARLTPQGVG